MSVSLFGKFSPRLEKSKIGASEKGRKNCRFSICVSTDMLERVGETLWRVISYRISGHLQWALICRTASLNFDGVRLTVDAIRSVRAMPESAVRPGRVASWGATLPAGHHIGPICATGLWSLSTNTQNREEESCGVPQGSVLCPLLWNLAYDVVHRTSLPKCRLLCGRHPNTG